MKQKLLSLMLLAVFSLLAAAAPRMETITSPNGNIRIEVAVGDQLQYSVYYGDELVLKDWAEAVIVPETCRQAVEPYVPEELKTKTHYLRNNCKDIWEWSKIVYEYVRDPAGE